MFSVNIYIYVPRISFLSYEWYKGQEKKKILNHTFTTILGEENVFHVDPPFPLEQCWVLQAKHILQDLNFVRGGGGKSC